MLVLASWYAYGLCAERGLKDCVKSFARMLHYLFFFHTTPSTAPWWMVDGGTANVSTVRSNVLAPAPT